MSQTVGFLDLPFDVRQLLYKACFAVDSELHLDYKRERHHKNRERKATHKPPSHVAFLRTCKMVHNEATPILYGHNKFVILGRPSRWTWIQAYLGVFIKDIIGPTPRQHITNVRIDMTGLDEHSVDWRHAIWPRTADKRLWNSLNTRFAQIKTISLTFGSVSSENGGERPNCFANNIAHDKALLLRQKRGPDTTQLTLTVTVVEGPQSSREPFVYVAPERQASYPPFTPIQHELYMGCEALAANVHVSHPADPSYLGLLIRCTRWDGYAFCPTNLPADGVYPVGSQVALVWRLPDCELELDSRSAVGLKD